jgi:hypothetical protein
MVLALLVLVVLLAGRRGLRGRQWLFYTFVFFLLSLGPAYVVARSGARGLEIRGIYYLPAAIFDLLPLMDGYRVFVRMGILVNICLALFIGLNWDLLVERIAGLLRLKEKRRAALGWGLLFLLSVLIVAPRIELPRPAQEVRLPKVYERVAETPKDVVVFEFPSGDWLFLWPQTRHHRPLVNFSTSRLSPAQEAKTRANAFLWWSRAYDYRYPSELRPPEKQISAENLRADFDQLGVDIVVVHADFLKPGDKEAIRGLMEGTLELEKWVEPLENAGADEAEEPEIWLYRNPRGTKFLTAEPKKERRYARKAAPGRPRPSKRE